VREEQLIAFCLKGVGRAACMSGYATHAAELYGASAALREAITAPLSPSEQASDVACVGAARRDLGEAVFDAAWRAGEIMTLEEAVASALID
jgi:hypothetical protein